MKNNSNISTSAGGIGNGGNIGITTDSLLAINNSDIKAKAVKGRGGNINITAAAILGLEERPTDVKTSDIDASSEFGQDGTVTITNPQVLIQDPVIAIRGVPLSESTQEIIKTVCNNPQGLVTDSRHPDFLHSPDDFSNQAEFPIDAELLPPSEKKAPTPTSLESLIKSLVWKPGVPLIPANHVVTLDDGRQFLVPKAQWEYVKSECNI